MGCPRWLVIGLACLPAVAHAAEWHVTPTGSPDGDGSEAAPWDLTTAWAHPEIVQPGDTIRLHGGTYPVVGGLTGSLVGTAEAPIIVRGAAAERVTLDTGDSPLNRIAIGGAYTWYWDFEVTSSAEDRWADDGNAADRGYSIDANEGPGLKLIDLVVHDTQGAIGFWANVVDEPEVYGCIIYYNGFDADDRGHGHAIYTQNLAGPKYLRENIMFGQYSHGIHAYTEGGEIDDFVMEGNISFENGTISTISGRTRNVLVGGAPVAENPQLRANYAWFDRGAGEGTSCDLGYGSGTANAIAQGNVCVGGTSFRIDGTPMEIAGNTFVGPTEGLDAAAWPDNMLFPDAPPTGATAFVRPNAYDPDRANVVVFNWELADEVDVDLSPLLAAGDGFELRDVQDYWGTPVLTGTFDGTAVAVPMTSTTVSPVVGTPATPYVHTSPEFGAFVLVRTQVGPGGTDDGGSESGGADSTGGSVDDTGGATASSSGTTVGTSVDDGGGSSEDTTAQDESTAGCACTTAPQSSLPWLIVAPLLRRRRKAHARPTDDRARAGYSLARFASVALSASSRSAHSATTSSV